jgi:hypothetical protein
MTDFAITTIPFTLRGVAGVITVENGPNDDPVRWGYDVLEMYDPELARGFPITRAGVSYPREGYAADMGWVQIVRYEVFDPGEEEQTTVFDAPPQLLEVEMPYMAFGLLPSMFDAPSIVGVRDVVWDADTFLVVTPDAVLTRVLRPLCGFRWGYRIEAGEIVIVPVEVAGAADWARNLLGLRNRFPSWTFEDSWAMG